MQKLSIALALAADRLLDDVGGLRFPGIPHVYQPLRYARQPHRCYLDRYGEGPAGRVLLVGMNPGPWGMGQTGVPFGDPVKVRDWMGIEAAVEAYPGAHPRCPVRGFASRRREGSGVRLYGWAEKRFGPADMFFAAFFVVNYAPVLLLNQRGANVTPQTLALASRRVLEEACDRHLRAVIEALEPACLVGVGRYAAAQLARVAATLDARLPVGGILHPSPANPLANQDWAGVVERQLAALGIVIPGAAG